MKTKTIYTARDGKEFDNESDATTYDYRQCTEENEGFVVLSGFYGQFRMIFRSHQEAIEFIAKDNEEGLIFKRVSLGKYGLCACLN